MSANSMEFRIINFNEDYVFGGDKISVTTKDGHYFDGIVSEIGESHFILVDLNTIVSERICISQISKLEIKSRGDFVKNLK